MSELKPCPFCGAIARLKKSGDTYEIDCFHTNKCYLYRVKPLKAFIKEAVINPWNRRLENK